MKLPTLLMPLLLLSTLPLESSELFKARVYRQGTDREELLFTLENDEIRGEEGILSIHRYLTPEGEIFAEESLLFMGEGNYTHSTSFYKIGEYSLLETRGDRMTISFRRGDRTREKSLERREDLLFGPAQQKFIRENYSALREGTAVNFSLPVPELTSTAEFYLKRTEHSGYGKPGHLVMEMGSSHFFINLILDEIFYVIDDNTLLIKEIHGPSLLRTYEGGKWKPADVDILFFYE